MDFNEAMAYAQASWSRFEQEVSDDLLRALCAAFAVVATADGHLDERESRRFLGVLRSNLGKLPKLDLPRLEQLFVDLSEALRSDPEGRPRVRSPDFGATSGPESGPSAWSWCEARPGWRSSRTSASSRARSRPWRRSCGPWTLPLPTLERRRLAALSSRARARARPSP